MSPWGSSAVVEDVSSAFEFQGNDYDNDGGAAGAQEGDRHDRDCDRDME